MSPQMADSAGAGRFKELFSATERDLLAYVLRRVDRPEDAADVVAETFLLDYVRRCARATGTAAR